MKLLQFTTVLCLAGIVSLIFLTVIDGPSSSSSVPRNLEEKSFVTYTYEAELVEIVDGNNVVLNVDLGFEHWLHNQRFRLIGIVAPEPQGKTKEKGEKAVQWLTEQIEGKDLVIQSVQNENWEDARDNYGCWLVLLFADGVNLNRTMVAAGHAEIDL